MTMALIRSASMSLMDEFRSFTSEFDKHRRTLEHIVKELKQICEGTRGRKKKVPKKAVTAATFGFAALGILFIPLTGGVSLAAAVGASAAAAGVGAGAAVAGVYLHDQKCDKATVDKVERPIREFRQRAATLNNKLEDVKNARKEQQKDTEVLVQTQATLQNVFTVFDKFETESSVERLLEISEQCSRTLEEMVQLRGE